MDSVRNVLKDSKIPYYDVKSKLPTLSNDKESVSGIQVMLPCLILTIQLTYSCDILDVNIHFKGTDDVHVSEQFAKMLAKEFTVVQPPRLNVVDKSGLMTAKDVDLLVKFESKYQCLLFIMLLYKFPHFEDDNNIL